jgi:hypothetical protein
MAALDEPSLQADRPQYRRHEGASLICHPRQLQRHGDRWLALAAGHRQSSKAAVQDQVTDVRLAGREAGEPERDVEVVYIQLREDPRQLL